jgi:hypothetical protein
MRELTVPRNNIFEIISHKKQSNNQIFDHLTDYGEKYYKQVVFL